MSLISKIKAFIVAALRALVERFLTTTLEAALADLERTKARLDKVIAAKSAAVDASFDRTAQMSAQIENERTHRNHLYETIKRAERVRNRVASLTE